MPPEHARPHALIDFRAPADDAPPFRLAFGTPRERLIARTLAEVAEVIRRAEAFARDGAWCVGSLRYEAAAAFDAALTTHVIDAADGAVVQFLVFDAPLSGAAADSAWAACDDAPPAHARWTDSVARAPFDAAIATIHRAIAAGEVYQVNHTAPLTGVLDGDPLALFGALRAAQPNAYAAYIDAGEDAAHDAREGAQRDTILSVSPELFFDWRDGRLLARPMKGTASRGHDAAADAASKAQLLHSAKERAENLMIVDLLRNDLSRVAEPFSVQVPRLFEAEAWPTVWQLTSDVIARTRPGTTLLDVLRALFPCGSVTGAPKVQAMRLIRALEPEPRGVYCGAIGVLQPGGAATFNVPIRTVTLRGRALRCGIGSGITSDALADAEWAEWRHKRAFLERASQPFELLETLRLADGRLHDSAAHLDRMASAATHFGFVRRPGAAEDALATLARQHPHGRWRVRLLAARDGTLRAEAIVLDAAMARPAVQLAASPMIDSDSEFVRHKTTRRDHYDAFAPNSPAVFDTLLWNERGELTEFTRGNLALRIDGEWLTPPLRCGLLPGIARARLLAEGRLREQVLRRDDLARAEGIAFVNSLRGWVDVVLNGAHGSIALKPEPLPGKSRKRRDRHCLYSVTMQPQPPPDTQNPSAIDPADADPQETAEWREALAALIESQGPARARQLLDALVRFAHTRQVGWQPELGTPYVNTIAVDAQPAFPGDLAIEERLASLMRWNALAMVVRANHSYGELGGHIASYASAADLFEVGFNHFFHARDASHGGDLVFFQPHSSPGVYARAFLEGRLSEDDLAHYRQELSAPAARDGVGARGLSSYPHPMLMPDFWQFPTGSMGIGPISAIYHARFMRYLCDRQLLDCSARKVWGVFGDGEMDEPESMSALTLAAREKLDNLVWVVNCNLQRLDGPVRGNGRIVDELEKLFAGAGWHVIKLLWGSDWDGLFARDTTGALTRAFANTVDGQMQTFAANDGRFNRDTFFGQNEELRRLAQGLTDEQIDRLKRGGHDIVKIHAAYAAAAAHRGQPTVILAHTKKGYGMGAGQGRMTTHSHKKFESADLIGFRNRFDLPLTDEQATALAFVRPAAESPEMRYLLAHRQALGGSMPKRETACAVVAKPELAAYAQFAIAADGKAMSTTMAFVRLLGALLKDAALGPRVVPIVADEARTFGMANLFKQVGIYSSVGQRYAPEDIDSILSYREATDGQILEEGISEAGAIASWTAAATSYSVHGLAMLPFYIYYSMFGFQRVGDQIWAAADQRVRGFLLGATSGRTTLGGEGLQHQDGSSHLIAATIPNCKAYDPAFAGEMAVIVDAGIREMMVEQRDVFYYVTLMNESYAQPSLPAEVHAEVLAGCYRFGRYGHAPGAASGGAPQVTLMGSGAILTEVIRAAELLAGEGIASEVFSVTSWSELARDGAACEAALLRGEPSRTPFIAAQLADGHGPIVAATDYVRALPESIRAWLPAGRRYLTLGTDGFGRSDTRAALRDFFGVDAAHIAQAARTLLAAT